MDLGFGQLLTVMSAMHPEVEERVVKARLKYFQRLPFPSEAIRVGTGGRADYPPEDVMKVVLAFELLASGMPPVQAAALVEDAWSRLSRGIAKAWIDRGHRSPEALIFIRPDGMEARRGGTGGLVVGGDTEWRLWRGARDPGDRRLTVVDAALVASALENAILDLSMPVSSRITRAITGWCDELRGTAVKTGT